MHDNEYWDKKTRKKFLRSIFELLFILGVVLLFVSTVYTGETYQPFLNDIRLPQGQDNGFIAVAYDTVGAQNSQNTMSRERLETHVKALLESGYVTISQQDILDYYQKGTTLPEKALFLMFGDGRRDTATYTQEVLENNNLLATMLSYGENLEKGTGSRILNAKDLLELRKSGFWEMGVSGYRLYYINVFDEEGTYLGDMDLEAFQESEVEIGTFNHYLMDYLYDKDQLPMESNSQMIARIKADYDLMVRLYDKNLGGLPPLYTLMHANSGQYGSTQRVSDQNETHIKALFQMNFNRAGESLNKLAVNSDIYDMTRIEPKAYWSANHLMTHIEDDTGFDVAWQVGEKAVAADWELLSGHAEFCSPNLYLTSPKNAEGRIRLLDSQGSRNLTVSVTLAGNMLGRQGILLRGSETQGIWVELKNNHLLVQEQVAGGEQTLLFDLDLYEFDGTPQQERKTGAIPFSEGSLRTLTVTLNNAQLEVFIGEQLVCTQTVSVLDAGSVYLLSEWGQVGEFDLVLGQFVDDVYDAVFRDLTIQYANQEEVAFCNSLEGFRRFLASFREIQRRVSGIFVG